MRRQSFIKVFTVAFILCNLALTLLACSLYYRSAVNIIVQSSYNYTNTIMVQAEQNFDNYIKIHRQLLDSIADNEFILSADQCFHQGDTLGVIRNETYVVDSIKSARKSRADVSDVLIVMESGLLINREARWALNTEYDFKGTEWYRSAYDYDDTGKLDIRFLNTDFYMPYSPNSNNRVVAIGRPIYSYSREKIGVVIYLIYVEDFWINVLNGYHSQYGDILLLDKQDAIIAHSQRGMEGERFTGYRDAVQMDENTVLSSVDAGKPILLSLPSAGADCTLLCTINLDIRRETGQLMFNIVLIVVLCLALNLALTLYIARRLQKPVRGLVNDTKAYAGEGKAFQNDYGYAEFNYIAANFNVLLQRIDRLGKERMDMETSLRDARMDALVSKINPHFLFNSLQLVQTENLYGTKEKTNQVILSLSNQLRYSLYNDRETVSVRQEIDGVNEYLNLCRDIYEDNLDFEIDVSPALMDYSVPKSLVHLAVENSIKHGFKGTPDMGMIRITGREEGEDMVFIVEDNGVGVEPDQLETILQNLSTGSHKGVGLRSITQQIRHLFGGNYGVDIRCDDNLTRVIMRIPRRHLN